MTSKENTYTMEQCDNDFVAYFDCLGRGLGLAGQAYARDCGKYAEGFKQGEATGRKLGKAIGILAVLEEAKAGFGSRYANKLSQVVAKKYAEELLG